MIMFGGRRTGFCIYVTLHSPVELEQTARVLVIKTVVYDSAIHVRTHANEYRARRRFPQNCVLGKAAE